MKRILKKSLAAFCAAALLLCVAGCTLGGRTARTETVFGEAGEEDTGVFAYLYPELLMTSTAYNEATQKMESHRLVAYLPIDTEGGISSLRRGLAETERMGIAVRVEILDDYILRNRQDYSLADNLTYLLEKEYENSDAYGGQPEFSEPAENGNRATATVSYWDENYDDEAVYEEVTAVLLKTDAYMALATITVDYDDLGGQYEQMVSELEVFYGVELHLDQASVEAKKNAENKPTPSPSAQTDGSVVFETPQGWKDMGDGMYQNHSDNDLFAMVVIRTYAPDKSFADLVQECEEGTDIEGLQYTYEVLDKPLGKTIVLQMEADGEHMLGYAVDLDDGRYCTITLGDAGGKSLDVLKAFGEHVLTTGQYVPAGTGNQSF